MIFLIIIGSLAFIALSFCYYLGVFISVKAHETVIPALRIVYREYIGVYKNIGPEFQNLVNDGGRFFKNCPTFGIYYDIPNEIADENECRAVIGYVIGKNKYEDFMKAFPDKYKFKNLPSTKGLQAFFPYKVMLSILIGIKKAIPALSKEFKKYEAGMAQLKEVKNCGCTEIYHLFEKEKYIEYLLPLGPNHIEFYLTSAKMPKYKPGSLFYEKFKKFD